MALTKVDDRGLKTPIDLQDNEQIRLGTGNDLRIYHDGTQSYIRDFSNQFNIRANNAIKFEPTNGSETYAKFVQNGAVELYYNNNKTFETKNAGCIITGGLDCGGATFSGAVNLPDNYVFSLGSSTDLQLYHNGSNSYISNRGAGLLVIEATTGEAGIVLTQNGSAALYYDSIKKFETTSNGITVTDHFYPATDNASDLGSSTLRFRNQYISASGSIDFLDGGKIKMGNSDDLQIYHDGSHNYLVSNNGHVHIIGDGTNQVKITAKNGEQGILIKPDNNVELYYDDSKKFETTSAGATVTGALTATSFSGDGIIPAGGIIIWSGAANAIPTGWVLCNGSNSTPDLRDRFVIGAGSTYSVGDTGGHSHINLTTSQLPAHDHTFSGSDSHSHGIPKGLGGSQADISHYVADTEVEQTQGTFNTTSVTVNISGTTSSVGSGSSVENRPPYYALCYIMKT